MDSLDNINNGSFQTLFELNPSIAAIIDAEKNTFNKINSAFIEILGYNKENLIGKTIDEINLFPNVAVKENLIKAINNKHSIHNLELEVNTHNGTIHCKLIGDVLNKETKKEYIIMMNNLTSQKNVEDNLKSAEFKIMTILDTLPIQSWIKDLNGVYLDVNKEFLDTWGKSLDQVLGCTDADIFPMEVAKQYSERDKIVIESGERTHFEEVIYNEKGRFFYETYKSPIRNASGEICGTFGISKDITNKKRIAAELVKSKELAEAHSEAKSMFLANMSHEIRTPLNGLMGFLQLLDNTQLTQQQLEFLNNIKISSKMLKIVTDDILDVSKIYFQGIKLENFQFDLHKTIENAIIPFTADIYNKKVDLNLFIHPNVPQFALGDPVKLRQAISNIFYNAIKFTEKGSILVVAILDNENEGKYKISFKIKDTGVGIPQKAIKELFSPFKRANNTIYNKAEGSGLGLYISKSIINKMNGSIRVKSKVGIGTTFIFDVWLEKTEARLKNSKQNYSKLKNKKVLIVGNNTTSNSIIKNYLNEKKVVSVENRNGIDTIAETMKSNGCNYNAIIISHDLYDIDPYELISVVKTIYSTKYIPILLILPRKMTNKLPFNDLSESIGIIYKPFRKDDLYNSLIKAFKNSSTHGTNETLIHESSMPFPDNKVKLLIAEDDQVIIDSITSHISDAYYDYDIVYNGQEAVIAFANSDYDVIIMNCNMPVMDGYEATKQIRQIESNVKYTPIIGLSTTSNQYHANKCFKAGMDEFVIKPLDLNSLEDIVKKYSTVSLVYSSKTKIMHSEKSFFDNMDFYPEIKQKVMIIDDTPMNLELLKIALTSEYDITIVINGKDALDIAYKNPPDIILLDVAMPGMDGYEILSKLRENEQTKDVPVVFLTALQDMESEEYGLKLGAIDFIRKPFSIPIVKAKLKNHLDLKKYKDFLKEISLIDPLTKTPNRRRFDEALSEEIKKANRSNSFLSLLMLDIDNFKKYNDTYGHIEGDECLIKIAKELKKTLKRPSDLVARWGGEEFTCLLPETDRKGAVKVAEKLRKAIRGLAIPHETSEVARVVTVSIGIVTLFPNDKLSKEDLLKQADDALYRAKDLGRDCVSL